MNSLLREALGWLAILPPFAGCAVAAMHLGRSRWAPVLMGAFGVQTLVVLFFRVAVFLQMRGSLGSEIQIAYTLASLVSLLAAAAVVAGVAGLLAEAARRPQ